jgi:hypothetical protein
VQAKQKDLQFSGPEDKTIHVAEHCAVPHFLNYNTILRKVVRFILWIFYPWVEELWYLLMWRLGLHHIT